MLFNIYFFSSALKKTVCFRRLLFSISILVRILFPHIFPSFCFQRNFLSPPPLPRCETIPGMAPHRLQRGEGEKKNKNKKGWKQNLEEEMRNDAESSFCANDDLTKTDYLRWHLGKGSFKCDLQSPLKNPFIFVPNIVFPPPDSSQNGKETLFLPVNKGVPLPSSSSGAGLKMLGKTQREKENMSLSTSFHCNDCV